MASIVKRTKSRFWIACYTNREGRQLKRSTKTTDKRQALQIALELERVERQANAGALTTIQLRNVLLGDAHGTKQEMAEMLVKHFPDELAMRLPPKRRPWESTDARMDIFDAVGLVVAFRKAEVKSSSSTSQ